MSEGNGNGFGALRLNIGSGADITMKGYVNVDAKYGSVAFPLAYGDNVADEIYASHILEHFPQRDVSNVLKDWTRALRPGGVLKIAVPNFEWIAKELLSGNPSDLPLGGYLMGGQVDEHDFHKSVFNRATLEGQMQAAGLADIQPWVSEVRDCASLPVSLNLMGRKPEAATSNGNGHSKLYTADSKPPDARYEAFVRSIEPKNTYSQFGEDGIIEAIFNRIGATSKWCCEVGAADGLFFSNTRRLIEQGWQAVLVEADNEPFERLRKLYDPDGSAVVSRLVHAEGFHYTMPQFALWRCMVRAEGETSVDEILKASYAPTDIDLLSIDIDSQDYYLVNSLQQFYPRVLIVEYDPDADPMYIPAPGAGDLDQAGRLAMQYAAEARGYDAICRTPCNLICVRRDLTHLLVAPAAPKAAPVGDYAHMDQQVAQGNIPHIVNGNSKVFAAGQWREIGHQPGQVQLETTKCAPIAITTSTPRYGSLLAADTMWQVATALRAVPGRAGGAWWEQGLTRQIEKFLELETERGKVEFIITVDFDSYMTPEDGLKLIRLMYENPQLDAIVPMQVRRGMFEEVLAQSDGPVTITDPLVPIVHGHFGFTVFRRRVFERLSTPWFLNVPDEDGRWQEGRKDADIYFWNKFCDQGFKAAMSTEVVIGHGDEGICWPKLVDGKWTKVWQSVFEWIQTHKPPEGIIKVA